MTALYEIKVAGVKSCWLFQFEPCWFECFGGKNRKHRYKDTGCEEIIVMNIRRTLKKGFTLVEILIVVVILGILAAVVIPQFTSASESAKGSSLVSQLQTIRSQLELAQIQHNGAYPAVADIDDWACLTSKTDAGAYTTVADGDFGPYLQQAPVNSFSGGSTVAADNTEDWVYHAATGTILPVLTAAQATTAFGDGSTVVAVADMATDPGTHVLAPE